MPRRLSPVVAIVGVMAAGLFVVWLVGQTFRDWVWLTALCFYFPSPAAAVILLGTAGLSLWRGRRWVALVLGLLALGPLGFVLFVENQWFPPTPAASPDRPLRLVHWNVGEAAFGWSPIINTLTVLRPDVCVISEMEEDPALTALAEELGEGYSFVRRGDLSVVVRGRLTAGAAESCGKAQWFTADWEADGVRLKLLAADFPSDLTTERGPLLTALRKKIEETSPDLVLGDFNAPRRSWGLSDLPSGYRHAYDLAGSGWSYTWPVPVPLLAIDQCLIGPRVAVSRYELRSTAVSDHRLQLLDIGLAGR